MPQFSDTNTSYSITSRSFLASAAASQSGTTSKVSQFDSWILQKADTSILSTISAEKPSVTPNSLLEFAQSTMKSDYAQHIVDTPDTIDNKGMPSEAPLSSCFDGKVTDQLAITRTSQLMLLKLFNNFAKMYDLAKDSDDMDDAEIAEAMCVEAMKRK